MAAIMTVIMPIVLAIMVTVVMIVLPIMMTISIAVGLVLIAEIKHDPRLMGIVLIVRIAVRLLHFMTVVITVTCL